MSADPIAWPSGVEFRPERGAYKKQPADNRRAFQPELGPPKIARRHTAFTSLHNISLPLPESQLEDLEEYYEDTLADGSTRLIVPVSSPVIPGAICQFETPIESVPSGAFNEDGEEVWRAMFVLRKMP